MPFLTLKIGYFWAKKKSTDLALFGRIMKFFWSNHSAVSPLIWSTHPLLAWGGHQKALFSVFLVVNILKFDINCTFFLGLFSTYQAKNQKARPWGFAQTPLSLARPQGHVAKPIHIPWAECWSRFKASRVKCTTASP